MAFVALVPVYIVWALLAPELDTSRRAPRPSAVGSACVSVDGDSTAVSPDTRPKADDHAPLAAESEIDLYGNDVSDAVAEYGLDATGRMYEVHTPQVELPHLGSPKS